MVTMEERGDTIVGSRFIRDFCADCGEPIRVISIETPNYCTECRPEGTKERLPGSHLVGEKLHLGKPQKHKRRSAGG